ncbi:uncharacterized protein LODBEIA_P07830 [Lodderomyces beijingensis]|uniref:Xaa-Pro aminopeptidase P n=1 Tax=Lodderomyces beijingensis TaxID=1775926 RepID=A0ABP0ZFD3_9ASCO
MSSEKEPLLAKDFDNDEHQQPLSLKAFLLTPFQTCLPHLGNQSYPADEGEVIDYADDDSTLPDLPYVADPIILPRSKLTQSDKLVELRKQMKAHGIGVYIVPSEDEHQSEYTALSDKRREFLSGFTGSAGVAVVTLEDANSLQGSAYLSTDGRYFLQAEQQLDPKLWRLIKEGSGGKSKSWTEQVIDSAVSCSFSRVVSCDPRTLSLSLGEYFKNREKYADFKFRPLLKTNLVDVIWGDEQPKRSLAPIYHLDLKYCGEHTNSKLARVRGIMRERNATHYVVTELDSVAWLFNLRCDRDIPFSPVFFSYAIISLTAVTLYVDDKKLPQADAALHGYLSSISGLHIAPYGRFYSDFSKAQSQSFGTNTVKFILPSKDSTTFALYDLIQNSNVKNSLIHESIIAKLKVFKNRTESFNARVAQYKDSLVFIMFASWLQHQLVNKGARVSEYDAACKIFDIRQGMPNFKGLSYETISSSGPNAAIIHYAPTKDKHDIVDVNAIYLLDSGAHYLEGTTDITRTWWFSPKPVKEQYKKYYTLVLKGHLAIAMAKLPQSARNKGTILDACSRQPLWNHGLDFNHGVGHGIGSFGLVHEAPFFISSTVAGPSDTDFFKPGAITSDEPGYYIDGEVGFRIESELQVCELDGSFGKSRDGKNYLGFEYQTKVPFCTRLIDTKYLTKIEIDWINDFHNGIRKEFGQELLRLNDKRAFNWLLKETEPIA